VRFGAYRPPYRLRPRKRRLSRNNPVIVRDRFVGPRLGALRLTDLLWPLERSSLPAHAGVYHNSLIDLGRNCSRLT
jgi:hypothetical protein